MSKLKRCPFCGSKARIEKSWRFDNTFASQCTNDNCIASNREDGEFGGFESDFNTKNKAIESWNTRPIEDAQAAEIKKLTAELNAVVEKDKSDIDKLWSALHRENDLCVPGGFIETVCAHLRYYPKRIDELSSKIKQLQETLDKIACREIDMNMHRDDLDAIALGMRNDAIEALEILKSKERL
jgi:hypothetical protein